MEQPPPTQRWWFRGCKWATRKGTPAKKEKVVYGGLLQSHIMSMWSPNEPRLSKTSGSSWSLNGSYVSANWLCLRLRALWGRTAEPSFYSLTKLQLRCGRETSKVKDLGRMEIPWFPFPCAKTTSPMSGVLMVAHTHTAIWTHIIPQDHLNICLNIYLILYLRLIWCLFISLPTMACHITSESRRQATAPPESRAAAPGKGNHPQRPAAACGSSGICHPQRCRLADGLLATGIRYTMGYHWATGVAVEHQTSRLNIKNSTCWAPSQVEEV